MKTKFYYLVRVKTKGPKTQGLKKLYTTGGQHIIKAFNKKDALRIAKVHGIAYPWGHPDREIMGIYRMKPEDSFDRATIQRRQKGIGGRIWMENVYGELEYEE